MTARSFISSHRNCRRFLAATHLAAILNNYSHDLQVLHFTVERGRFPTDRESAETGKLRNSSLLLNKQFNLLV